MRWSPNYFTACRIQDKILDKIGVARQSRMDKREAEKVIKGDDLSPSELSTLAKAWETLEERKRIIRMKPLPKAQEVPQGRPLHERKSRSSFSET